MSKCYLLEKSYYEAISAYGTCIQFYNWSSIFLDDYVKFLEIHPEVDMVGFCTLTAIRRMNPDEEVSRFTLFSMKGASKPLRIPHMTQIDGNHFVMGKVPNLYVARTDKVRSIGWDENIRMLDHQDFL